MATDEGSVVFDVRFLAEASKKLHGYLLHTWFIHYLSVIFRNARRLMDAGAIGRDARPSRETDYAMLFDVEALDLEKISYIVGFYFYILSSHKKCNYVLMQENQTPRILYLRGFDYEGAVSSGGEMALGYSSMDTMQFTYKLGDHLAEGYEVFKPLSSKDLYWETISAQRHFYGDFENIIHLSSQPIRSFYLNANQWQEDIAQLIDRMDYFVVYVSSITKSVLWELEQLQRRRRVEHTTVVFDDEAIDKKDTQTGLRDWAERELPDDVLWAKDREGAPAPSAQELRDQLGQTFLVVSPDEFFANRDLHERRIAAARGIVGPGEREAPLAFRFYPALDSDGLTQIRDFDDELGSAICELVSSRSITNLPWFMNEVQLKIFTTLMLGDHAGTGRALAAYAAVVDVVRSRISADERPPDDLTDEQRAHVGERLTQHFEMADYVGFLLLSYGQSHEFGDYRADAKKVYAEQFESVKDAAEDFYDEAYRRRGV